MNLSNVDGETPMDGVASTTAISPEELSHLIHEVKQSRFRNGDKCYVVPMEYWNSLVSSLNSGSLGTISEISCSSIISEDKNGYSLKSGLLVHTDIQTLPESVFIRLREAFGVENEDRDVIPVILDNDTVKPCMKEVPPITREELGALIKESEDHAMILGEKWYIIPKQWWNTVHTAYKNGFPEDIKQINCAKISTETLDGYFLKADLRESVDYIYLPQIVFDRFRKACGLAREQRDVIEREVVKRKDQLILQTYQRVVTVILARDSSVSCSILLTGEESMAYIRDAILRELNLTNIPLSALRFYITSSESSDSWELIDPTQENVDAYFDTAQKVCLDVNDENGWLINSKTKKVSLFGPQSQAAWWYMMYRAVCMLTNWRWLLSAATSLLFRLHSTNPYSSRSYGALPPKEQPVGQHIPGVCGLHNLGNTCFMASAMQCLSNVPPLTNYILSGEYKKDVNLDNPLGTHGELVAAYADLLHILWCGDNSAIHPRKLKATIGQFAPRFSGYAQQDSQELLAYVLDGLHEDLNRVKKKPYIQENESADQMEEHEKAAQSWKNYKIRNDSIIVDKFHGQLKSKLVCPVCSKVSIKFDPFCFLSVPLPPKDRLPKLTITVMYNSIPKKKWAKFTITMSSSTLAGDVCKYIKTQLQNDNDDSFQLVLFAAGINNDDVRILDMFEPVIFDDGPHELFAAQVTMTSGHKKYIVVKNQNTTGRVLSLPMIFSLKNNEEISETFIKEKVLRFISETYHTRGMRSDEEYKIMVTDGKDILPYPDGLSSTNSLVTLIFQWKEAALFNQYKGADLIERECALSTRKDIHLMDCIDIFTREEQLGEDDSWYCPNCKKHERATKKLDLWTLPEILIIHLKRFHYSRWNRDKIDTPVVIPVSGFELNDKIANEKHEHVKYDLIAISHHAGGLGGGHYTAAALNQHTGKWYDYNDSSAFEGTTPSNPCTSRTPYLLFYQRRTVVPDAAHTDSNFEMETD